MRALPSGEIMISTQTITKMLAAPRKNQSSLEVSQFLTFSNKGPAASWNARVRNTKATMVRPDIMNTGLWMSSPNGPMVVWMLSWPISYSVSMTSASPVGPSLGASAMMSFSSVFLDAVGGYRTTNTDASACNATYPALDANRCSASPGT